ncbi:DUF5696 domain-containing protein [Paenibacillus mendelii]|uniref:DUF5696 domain-containing protein n=1 Tax=Paenibacillus mendelii TaxID=206163 RepID=A0ABV6JJQ3_9BACL|nr:DUF5696 domain-containing protein [Paenibacillus mendelii]MCQ6559067.1 DUF5696 domain-containing protein [Paenibacillus mendelii]
MSRLRTKRWILLALLAAAAFTSITLWAVAAPSEEPQLEAEQTQTQDQAQVQQEQQEQNREETNTKADQAAEPAESGQVEDRAVQQPAQAPDQGAGKGTRATPLPGADVFQAIAASDRLELKADPSTGHFIVTDKINGSTWRSFPNPEGWSDTTTDAWKLHLQSPFMLRYVEFNVRKDLEKESNFIAQNGKVTSFNKTEDGFRVVYELPELGFVIPVQVRLKDDYVETRIIQEGLIDEKAVGKSADSAKDPKARLVSIRLFPFLGSETSDQENGFLLIPDGPGALIDFKKDQPDLINFYNERIYGEDWAYSYNSSFSNRQAVKMPVFGIKSGQQAVLGILQEGAEYASVYAVPSKSFSQYNWVTPEHHYRFKFFQPTDTRRNGGFFTYSQDLIQGDRATRYYFLSGGNPDYVDLAVRYRMYLTEEAGVKPLKDDRKAVPLHLNLLGADTEKGFLWDSYLPLTTTDQAKKIVRELSSLGVEQMSIAYMGWQKGGYSEYGGHFPIAGGLGGNDGMRTFVDYAHSKGFPVYLDASSYSFNNTGRDGFRKSRDGLRDLSSAVIDFRNKVMNITLVSPKFTEKIIKEDLEDAKRLNVDGYLFGEAIGSFINSDYNDNYPVMRQESRQVQEDILRTAKEKLGSVMVSEGNFYTARYADHLDQMYSDYSYDMFVDRIVPFAQIALHGLVSYSHSYANLSGDYVNNYLKGIEYGAEPSFLITYAPSQDLMKSKSLNIFYSTSYKDWTEEMVSLYQHYNDALAGVRDQFIVGHRELAEGVFETEYSNGRRIVVNYNEVPYTGGGISVKANDFIATGGE